MRLAKAELVGALKDLAAAFPTGKERDLERLAEGYYGALLDCSYPEIRGAVSVVIREDRFFPPASRLRRLVFEHRKTHPPETGPLSLSEQYQAWARDGYNGPCPVCGSVMEWPDGKRGRVMHDEQRHREMGISYSYTATARDYENLYRKSTLEAA